MGSWNATLEDTGHSQRTALLHSLSFYWSSTLSPSNITTAVKRSDVWPWRTGLFGVGGICIACVGVVCNCIAIVVLTRYKNSQSRSSAPLLLIFLEISDTVFLVSELFLENMVYVVQGGLVTKQYSTFIKPIYCVTFTVPHIAWTCSTLFVVVITIERYIVVARPLSVKRLCRSANVKLAAVFVVTFAVAYHTPLYLAYECPRSWNNTTQTEEVSFIRSKFGSSNYFNNVHMTWVKLCLSFLVPFLLLLTFNTLLLRVLRRSNTLLVEINQRRNQREKKLTLMVLSMTAIFFLCELMSAISFILTSGLNSHQECSYHCIRFTAVADTFVIVNAASNFATYCASGRKFREIFLQIFLKRPQEVGKDSRSGSSATKINTKLKKFINKNTEKQLMSVDDCSDNESTTAQRHLSLSARVSDKFLEHHSNNS